MGLVQNVKAIGLLHKEKNDRKMNFRKHMYGYLYLQQLSLLVYFE